MAVLSVYAMVERREAFQPAPRAHPAPAVVEAGQRPKLWVIGIDAATLDAILPLAGQGRLPFLATVLQNGAYGRLSSIVPTRRDALWTTLATGKYPFKHGITGRRAYRRPSSLPAPSSASSPPGSPSSAGASWAPSPCRRARRGARRWRSGRSCRGSAFPPAWSAGRRPTRGEAAARADASRSREGPLPSTRAIPGSREPPAATAPAVTLKLAGENPQVEAVFLLLPGLREVSRRWFGGFNAVQFEGGRRGRRPAPPPSGWPTPTCRLDDLLAAVWARGRARGSSRWSRPMGSTPEMVRSGRWRRERRSAASSRGRRTASSSSTARGSVPGRC